MAKITRRIGLSLGADTCWPICFEELVKDLDLQLALGNDSVSFEIERVTIEPFDLRQPARYERSGKLVAPDAHRIVALSHRGRPIDEQARFLVATNNYRASGGGNFPGLDGSSIVIDAPDENRSVLLQHLGAMKQVDPQADGNWRIRPVPGVRMRFVSGAGGIAHLARHPGITLVRDNGDGSALYELRPEPAPAR